MKQTAISFFSKQLLALGSVLLFNTLNGQSDKYKDVDGLIQSESMIDAMTALNRLKNNHQADTADSEYWLRYSKASYTFYKYEQSEAAINKAIRMQPQNAAYYFEKGLFFNRIGNLDSSLKSLNRALDLKSEGDYHYWRGIVRQQQKDTLGAVNDYRAALNAGFESSELYNNFAIALFELSQFDEGLRQVNKGIAMNPKYAQAYSARSKFYLRLLNADSACVDKSRANRLGYQKTFNIPDSVCNGSKATQLKFMADIAAADNSYSQAIKAYTQLIENYPPKSDYFLNRGYCYYKTHELEKAEKDYLQALELPGPARDMIYDNLSLLYFDQNKFQKSLDYAGKRIELNPRNHVPYIDRGLCYRKLKKYKEAEKDFNKSLELKPDFFRAFGYRAFLFLELGQYENALQDANRSVELNPSYGYGYVVLGQAKIKLGLPDYCVDFYKARKFNGPDAEQAIEQYCK